MPRSGPGQAAIKAGLHNSSRNTVKTVKRVIHNPCCGPAAKHNSVARLMYRTRYGSVHMHGQVQVHQQALGTRYGPKPIKTRYSWCFEDTSVFEVVNWVQNVTQSCL